MGWPVCNYPRYLYPLEENLEHNKQQDDKCLAEVEDTIEKQLKAGCPAAGIIAEPVQAEGGDHHGSAYWFQDRVCQYVWKLARIFHVSEHNFYTPKDRLRMDMTS